jgi:hypothetical protein
MPVAGVYLLQVNHKEAREAPFKKVGMASGIIGRCITPTADFWVPPVSR